MKKRKLIILCVLLIILACVVYFYIISSNILLYKVSSKKNTKIINNDPVMTKNFDWWRFENIEKYNKYSYHGKLVTYEINPNLEYPDQQVSVFLYKNGNKKELIKELSIDISGGTLPVFKKTSNPKIILLNTSSGDMGWRYAEYIYINLETEEITTVYIENGISIKITKDNQISEVGFEIIGDCGDDLTNEEGKTVFVKGISVNKKIKKEFSKLAPITCLPPDLFGGYEPNPEFTFKGIGKELSKLYFSDNITNKTYSVDLNNQEIKEETTSIYL